MESINSTSNSISKPVSDIAGKSIKKSNLFAYNNVDFKSFINNSNTGQAYIKKDSEIQNSFDKQISDSKQSAPDNHEYEKVVNDSKGSFRPYHLHSKRFLKSFHPVPTGKAYPKVVTHKPGTDKSTPSNLSMHKVSNIEKNDIDIKRFPGVVTHKQGMDKSTLSNLPSNQNLSVEKSDFDIKTYPNTDEKSGLAQQISKYKEDQLLSNPGGDNFFLERQEKVIDNTFDHSTFSNRVGKDLFDGLSNLKNLVKDLGSGSEVKYLDKSGNVKTRKKVGLLKTIGNFFKNIASGLSFGAYTPDKEEAPVGVAGKVKHFFKKVFVQAIYKDLFVGVRRSMNNVGENVLFAGLNLIETIPDAIVGHTKIGRKITTQVFDNVQVAMDFGTDIMPGGEASTRMKSFLVKKIRNLKNPDKANETHQYVRSSPFRKVIEALSFFIPFRI